MHPLVRVFGRGKRRALLDKMFNNLENDRSISFDEMVALVLYLGGRVDFVESGSTHLLVTIPASGPAKEGLQVLGVPVAMSPIFLG